MRASSRPCQARPGSAARMVSTRCWRPAVGDVREGAGVGVWAAGLHERRFAFFRLNSQGITAVGPSRATGGTEVGSGDASVVQDPDVWVIRLAAPSPRTSDLAGETKRVYHHRWPVRMHKVRQWYPSHQEHRVIWRGPYIKGPADAPLMMGGRPTSWTRSPGCGRTGKKAARALRHSSPVHGESAFSPAPG
jgi:hypothetical protein